MQDQALLGHSGQNLEAELSSRSKASRLAETFYRDKKNHSRQIEDVPRNLHIHLGIALK